MPALPHVTEALRFCFFAPLPFAPCSVSMHSAQGAKSKGQVANGNVREALGFCFFAPLPFAPCSVSMHSAQGARGQEEQPSTIRLARRDCTAKSRKPLYAIALLRNASVIGENVAQTSCLQARMPALPHVTEALRFCFFAPLPFAPCSVSMHFVLWGLRARGKEQGASRERQRARGFRLLLFCALAVCPLLSFNALRARGKEQGARRTTINDSVGAS
jgi:hypothetical protein